LLVSGTWFETFLYNVHLWSTAFGEQVQGIELLNGKPEGQGEKDPRIYFLNTKSSLGCRPSSARFLSVRSSLAWHPGVIPSAHPGPAALSSLNAAMEAYPEL